MITQTNCYSSVIREQYKTGNTLIDAMVTHYMAKPLTGQTPYWTPSAQRSFWISAALLFAFPMLVCLASLLNFGFALVVSYVAAVAMTGLFRKFQVEYGHHASHRSFVRGNREKNNFYLNLSTTIALCQNGVEYRKEHNEHHDRSIFTTEEDADAALLMKFGFKPGLSRKRLWLKLISNLLSPYFHAYFFWQRLRSSFVTRSSWTWRVASAVWLTFLCSTGFLLPLWIAVVAIWLPLTIFYQMSALIQFVTEHAWMITQTAPTTNKTYAERCWGRFMGERLPEPSSNLFTAFIIWSGFLLRHVFLHLPGRYAIIVGDMPAHDWHHLAGYLGVPGHNCPAGIYERQRAIEAGDKLRMAERELWGVIAMINHIFIILEHAPHMVAIEADKEIALQTTPMTAG